MQIKRNPKDTRVEITCETCGKIVLRKRYRALDPTRRQFCSPKCGHANHRRKSLAERFWPKVDMTGECWLWTGGSDRKGYGCTSGEDGRDLRATHAAWMLAYGPVPDGLWVRHQCDNPPCVRPDHLLLGTPLQNSRDMVDRGRSSHAPNPPERIARGDRHGSRTHPEKIPRGEAKHLKLTEDSVREIHRLWSAGGVMQKDIAERFGVSRGVISQILSGKLWSHISPN